MKANDQGSTEFGRRLRTWRRQRGLSQFELAARAGTTPRHLSFLETGRSRPGTAMVLRLGNELDLPLREQNALLEAAGLAATYSHRPLDASELTRFSAVIDSLLVGHEPLPAAAIDRYGAIRRANVAFERLSPGLVGLEPEELVDRFFGPGPWRDVLVNWADTAAVWLARQRREIHRTADPRLEALIARAERLIGPASCATQDDGLPMVCSRIRVGEDVLELFTVMVRFDTASDVTLSELRIELIYPGNDAADRFFRAPSREPTLQQRTDGG
ncbi:MAG TPA: helix-turn-helix domain-containing protein [Gemmatimonadaceae bacterium]|nr:helix-turn-helix domain-containing protein [Gemmatimonadaceae bacterium]